MHSRKLFLAFFLLAGLFSISSKADHFWRHQRNAALEWMRKSETGNKILNDQKYFNPNFFYDDGNFDVVHIDGALELDFNSKFLRSHAAYLSWIFAQGYVHREARLIAQAFNAQDLPEFKEVSDGAFLKATRHWHELVDTNKASYDYSLDKEWGGVARLRLLSANEFYSKRKADLGTFMAYLDERAGRLNEKKITLSAYLARNNLTDGQRKTAEVLRAKWLELYLFEEDHPY